MEPTDTQFTHSAGLTCLAEILQRIELLQMATAAYQFEVNDSNLKYNVINVATDRIYI